MGNYGKGSNWERMVKKRLEDIGATVIRAAGSHGAADLVAFDRKSMVLIQCKIAKKSASFKFETMFQYDITRLEQVQVPPFSEKQIWLKKGPEITIYDLKSKKKLVLTLKQFRDGAFDEGVFYG